MRRLLQVTAAALLIAGCGTMGDGAKVVEGTDLTLGVQFPYADCDTMAVMNYLTGFRVTVAENARCHVKYSSAETNSYFGCVTTHVYKTIDAKVEPTVDSDEENDDDGTEKNDKPSTAKAK